MLSLFRILTLVLSLISGFQAHAISKRAAMILMFDYDPGPPAPRPRKKARPSCEENLSGNKRLDDLEKAALYGLAAGVAGGVIGGRLFNDDPGDSGSNNE